MFSSLVGSKGGCCLDTVDDAFRLLNPDKKKPEIEEEFILSGLGARRR